MPLAKSIFPVWCVLASSMHSTKVDMLIRDIFIMTSAIIISTMDIQRVHTNNIATKDCIPNILLHSSSNTSAQLSESLFSRKTLKR